MNYLRLLWIFLRIGAMNELAYRANFWVQLLQSLLNLGVALAGLAVIFSHTEELGGWQPAELLALLGVFFLMSGLIGALIQPSMQRFMEDVRLGTLDFTLTKPEDSQVLVSVGEVRIWKFLDVVQGTALIAVALVKIEMRTGLAHAAGFALTLAAGAAIVYSFWLVLATTTFWFIRAEKHPSDLPSRLQCWQVSGGHLSALAQAGDDLSGAGGLCGDRTVGGFGGAVVAGGVVGRVGDGGRNAGGGAGVLVVGGAALLWGVGLTMVHLAIL